MKKIRLSYEIMLHQNHMGQLIKLYIYNDLCSCCICR